MPDDAKWGEIDNGCLEDNLQEAVWCTIMRGPRPPPSERWKRNKSDVSRTSKAPKKPQEKVLVCKFEHQTFVSRSGSRIVRA